MPARGGEGLIEIINTQIDDLTFQNGYYNMINFSNSVIENLTFEEFEYEINNITFNNTKVDQLGFEGCDMENFNNNEFNKLDNETIEIFIFTNHPLSSEVRERIENIFPVAKANNHIVYLFPM